MTDFIDRPADDRPQGDVADDVDEPDTPAPPPIATDPRTDDVGEQAHD